MRSRESPSEARLAPSPRPSRPHVSTAGLLLWVVVPYVCFTVFAVGHVWSYRQDQFG
ncbi:respiratory nitrate reductase subunit gamma [Streptomyces sp. NPDC057257]|uniref:respiratory nitrate reductase subunit gamma n=1 Tax=Streptomyces sp. NPDC057257 TaxID=3346071 RepID=UPI0036430CAF